MLEVAHDDRQKHIRPIADILHEETDKLHRLSVAKTSLTGTPSGFKDIDDMTGGFQPGNLIVIAARPSMGKSALVANIAENAVLHGHAVALFSLEMSESELAQRFVASQAKIKGEELRRGKVAEARWPKILEACQRLAAAPLYVDDSSDTGVLEVRAKSRRLHQQVDGGLGLIIVDYLQLMRHEGRVESRVEQVGQISPRAQGARARARACRSSPSPSSAAPSSSAAATRSRSCPTCVSRGAIEQDADLVMFIYREEYYDKESERPGEADIIIAKHRNGPVGEVVLTFQKEYPRFMNYAARALRGMSRLPVRHVRRRRPALDEDDQHRLRLPLPSADDRPAQGAQPVGGDPAALPRRRFDRPPVTDIDAADRRGRRAASRHARRAARRRPGALVHGRRGHRQDDAGHARLPGGAQGRPLGGHLLAPPPAQRDPRHAPGRALPRRPARPPRPPSTSCTSTTSAPSGRRDWVLEELYSIVNARYEDERSIVITTNILDREALCEQITERTVSRLTEMCDELPLIGYDRRMDRQPA